MPLDASLSPSRRSVIACAKYHSYFKPFFLEPVRRLRSAASMTRSRAQLEQEFQFLVGVKNREDLMDGTTSCPKSGKRLVPVVTISGRTDLQCISCDDPAVKSAESPLTAPEKPIVAERV